MKHKIEDYLNTNCYLGYLFETQVRLMVAKGFKDEGTLRKRCATYLVTLIKEISARVPNNIQILKQMSLLSVHKCLKHNKPNITDILKLLNISDNDISLIETQWKKVHLIEWTCTTDTHQFWLEVYEYKDSAGTPVFGELAHVALGILSLPHSNAEIERQFSQMNVIKNKLRNRMKLTMLNSILAIRNGLRKINICCKDFTIPNELVRKIKNNETYSCSEDEDYDVFELGVEIFEN